MSGGRVNEYADAMEFSREFQHVGFFRCGRDSSVFWNEVWNESMFSNSRGNLQRIRPSFSQ
jgi:hypothetical protein